MWPFQRRGYPVAQIIEVGSWYHTTGDRLAALPRAGLERSTRAFAEFLHRIDSRAIHEVGAKHTSTNGLPNRNYPLADVMTAGQPTAEGLRAVAAAGYRAVVDLRGADEERGFDEARVTEELGMSYVSLPIRSADGVTYENAEALDRILAGIDGPVLVHCSTANRAGSLLALRARSNGAGIEASKEIAVNGGATSLMPIVEQRLINSEH